MNGKKTKYCPSCGGPVRSYYMRCRYCDSPIVLVRKISAIDRKRIANFAIHMDEAFDRKRVFKDHRTNGLFVKFNSFLLFGLSALVYKTTSLSVTAILIPGLALYIFMAYHKLVWYLLSEISDQKVYKRLIEPAIEQFLRSFNYFGGEWDSITRKLIKKGKLRYINKFLSPPKVKRKKIQGPDLVLENLDRITTNYAYKKEQLFESSFFLTSAYLVCLSLPAFSIISTNYWVPLLWIVPILIWLYLELSYITNILIFLEAYNPSKRFLEKKIKPVLYDYCKKTENDFNELMLRAKELDLFHIYYNIGGIKPTIDK